MNDAGTISEILETCNIVRRAGGTNPLDALMPAVPSNSTKCLIARNLNFECRVGGPAINHDLDEILDEDGCQRWFMEIRDADTLEKVRSATGWRGCFSDAGYPALLLPKHMADAAHEFDEAWSKYTRLKNDSIYGNTELERFEHFKDSDMWKKYGPYIEDELGIKMLAEKERLLVNV